MSSNDDTPVLAIAAADSAVHSPWRQEWPWNGGAITATMDFYDVGEEEAEATAVEGSSTTDAFAQLDSYVAPPALFDTNAATLPLPPPPPTAAFDFVGIRPVSRYDQNTLAEENITESANAYIARFHLHASSAEATAALVAIVPCLLSTSAQIQLGVQVGMDACMASLMILTSNGAIKWYWVGNRQPPRNAVPPFCIGADAMLSRPLSYLRNVLDSIQTVERHAQEDTLDQIIGHISMRSREW